MKTESYKEENLLSLLIIKIYISKITSSKKRECKHISFNYMWQQKVYSMSIILFIHGAKEQFFSVLNSPYVI